MTFDPRIRRLLARVCSARTLERIVDPTLADAAWERGRPAWRGYLALLRALALHAVVSLPGRIARVCADDEFAMAKAAGLAALGALIGAIPLIALPAVRLASFLEAPSLPLVLRLAPQALAITVPAALLIALPVAYRQHRISRRVMTRTIILSLAVVAVTSALFAVMPDANQSFRVLASGDPAIARGPGELHFGELRGRIDALNLTPGGRIASRRLEYVFQLRLALMCAPVPLGLLALGVSASAAGRKRPLTIGVTAATGYWCAVYAVDELAAGFVTRASVLPLMVAWGPMLLVAGAGVALLSRSERREAAM